MTTPWGPTGRQVYDRTYSRIKADGTRETWEDTVHRVVYGNLKLVYGEMDDWPEEQHLEYDKLCDYMEQFAIIPAGRHLWATGAEGRQYLFNCLSFETEVVTKEYGVKKIGELSGFDAHVRDGNGRWVNVTFNAYGRQNLSLVTFTSGRLEKHVYATPGHNWIVSDTRRDKNLKNVSTQNLKPGMSVLKQAGRKGPLADVSPVGVQAGFIFGDGTSSKHGGIAYLCGEKDSAMLKFFPTVKFTARKDGVLVSQHVFPRSWKNIPGFDEGNSYLLGWLAGYFAADGCVDERGRAMLHSAKLENIEAARSVAAVLGIGTNPVCVNYRKGYGEKETPLYSVSFNIKDLNSDFFLINSHRERYVQASSRERQIRARWTVKSVEPTDRVEEVYCTEVPTTHSFLLSDGLLTGNCHVAGWTPGNVTDHFEFTALRLFEGGGVGTNYSTRFTGQYGNPKHRFNVHIACGSQHQDIEELKPYLSSEYGADDGFRVEDSREGWAEALCLLIESYWSSYDYADGQHIVFNVSDVRPSGSPLITSGGTASGPAPFAKLLLDTAEILNRGVFDGMTAMEIDHAIAECVVAGGNRRSARMSLMHWADPQIFEFINCKADTGKHWTTNISVAVDDDFFAAVNAGHAKALDVLNAVTAAMLVNGEPGFWNQSSAQKGEVEEIVACNPCSEINLTAWENCNLGHVNLDWFVTDSKIQWTALREAHRLMTRFLVRATYGDVNDRKQRAQLSKMRRIGVGHFGVQGFWAKQGTRYSDIPFNPTSKFLLEEMYTEVRSEARAYAFQLRIPESVKVTTVAPTGTIAKLPGVTEGIHPVYARHYERRIRYSMRDSAQFQAVLDAEAEGFRVETDVYDASGMTKVVVYPTEDILLGQVRQLGYPDSVVESADELTVQQMLSVQRLYQLYWADNAVSYTCNVPEGVYTPEKLAETLLRYLPDLKGTTVMVDASREQAPYKRITEAEYRAATAKRVEDSTDADCKSGMCPVK